jgi:hypothetical protein
MRVITLMELENENWRLESIKLLTLGECVNGVLG